MGASDLPCTGEGCGGDGEDADGSRINVFRECRKQSPLLRRAKLFPEDPPIDGVSELKFAKVGD